MSTVTRLGSGEIELNRPKRRKYSVDYKLKVLAEADACTQPGQVAALLRREGLYSSNLTRWREQREAGLLDALAPVKPGPKSRERHPLEGRVHQLEKENRALERKLKRAEWLLEVSKKASELMEKMALGHQLEDEDSE
jgi:transposase-like protein